MHHHREATLERAGGLDDAAITGQVGLAGQHVHRLGAGDARQQFHRHGVDPGFGQGGDQPGIAEGAGDADQQGAARDERALFRLRGLHGKHHAGTGQGGGRIGGDLGSGGGELGVGDGRVGPCPGLDRDGQAKADELLDCLGIGRHAGLECPAFLQHRKAHRFILCCWLGNGACRRPAKLSGRTVWAQGAAPDRQSCR